MATQIESQTVDQMRFNLQTAPNLTNMATRFKLRPTPVVIHRIPSQHTIPAPLTLDERMTIASRLARREIEINSVWNNSPLDPPATSGLSNGFPIRFEKPPSRSSGARESSVISGLSNSKSDKVSSKLKTQVKFKEPKLKAASQKDLSTAGTCTTRDNEIDCEDEDAAKRKDATEIEINKTVCEIVRLRKELTKQMKKLKFESQNLPHTHMYTPTPHHDKGRLNWGEENKEEERQARRNEEQATRNARMLYQLQQKVREAQKELSRPTKPKHAKKLLAMNRLASAHRAALRTLHNLLSTGITRGTTHHQPHKVCNELTGLITQLSQLCTEAHVPMNGEIEDNELISLLRELKDHIQFQKDHRHARTQILGSPSTVVPHERMSFSVAPSSKHLHTKISTKRKKRSKDSIKAKGVMFNPRFRSKRVYSKGRELTRSSDVPHFARQTFASILKQSPKKLTQHPTTYSPVVPLSPPSCVNSTTPQSSPLLPSSPPPPPPPPPSSTVTLQESGHRKEQFSGHTNHISALPVSMPWEVEGQDMIEKEMARQVWLDNKVKEHVKELEDMKQMKIMAPDDEDLSKPEGKEMQPHESRERKNKSYTKEKKHTKLNTVNATHKSDHVTNVSDSLKDNIQEMERFKEEDEVTEEAIQVLRRPQLENMLQKLEEFEKEKSEINSRWRSVSYSDTHQNIVASYSDTHQNIVPPKGYEKMHYSTGLVTVNIPSELALTIENYKERYSHYLKLTGIQRDERLDRWKLVENTSDELFDEILSEIANEIQYVLDDSVEQMFRIEFNPSLQ